MAIPILSSPTDDVDNNKNHNPNHVYEVPIHRQNLGAFGVLLSYIPKQREDCHRRKSQESGRYVKRMQANQRVISRPEQIGLDGQAFLVDQAAPFSSRARQKDRSQRGSQKPPKGKDMHFSAP